jgi:hypothetical protein
VNLKIGLMQSLWLPNGDKAYIPVEKLTEYALNPEHPTGRHKARVFRSALGLTLTDVDYVRSALQNAAAAEEARPAGSTAFGDRYVIDFRVTTNNGSALVRSAWIIRHGETFPILTSCYVIGD